MLLNIINKILEERAVNALNVVFKQNLNINRINIKVLL